MKNATPYLKSGSNICTTEWSTVTANHELVLLKDILKYSLHVLPKKQTNTGKSKDR